MLTASKLKVLIIDLAGYSPPYDYALVQALRNNGVDARLVIPSTVERIWRNPEGVLSRPQSRIGNLATKARNFWGYLNALAGTLQTVRTWKPDIVHVQWLPIPMLDRLLLRFAARYSKLVYTMHNIVSSHESDSGLRGWKKMETIAVFDRIVVHSEVSAVALRGKFPEHANAVRVIPHGAFNYYRQLTTRVRDEGGPFQLVFLGSIKPYKGVDVLVDALANLSELTKNDWHLTIAGSPSISLEPAQAKVRELGLESRVTWILRHISEQEMADFLAMAHVVVLPYREIDQSGVLLAAVGSWRSVVLTNVGAFPEVVESGVNGILVPPGDSVALGAALAQAIDDDSLREKFEKEMRCISEGALSWQRVAQQTTSTYYELR